MWDFGVNFLIGMRNICPPRLGFGMGMGNNCVKRDGNGMGVPNPKPAPLPSLCMKILTIS